ncbi:Threonine/homoserine/homoserine lactone efflux protein [Mariniphaga anaerophila]|uniref:Threonine/homoserine/homoserine lactone efflux protein n=1 Tax=Mariniphaga anaerophila TaxID=1484053 RepID=A0A1M5F9N2_9BACT|nr:LysE family transporter [Mariniphaga anaerophila]SHF87802.1 Threonine/homoserine/homoserine lactone efflux protein [Mariniphaga anaerophila]
MLARLLLEGMFIGLLASVPIGPVNILVIQRTINRSRKDGFFSGLGVALSDTLYASFAAFSVGFILQFIKEYDVAFRITVSVLLLLLGLFILFSNPEKIRNGSDSDKSSYMKRFVSAFLLTISNPLIIFLHLALFTSFGIVLNVNHPAEAIVVLSGFMLGAVAWWFSITGIISRFRNLFSLKICLWFNRIAGSIIILLIVGSLIYFFFPDLKMLI